jgi:hypothetical protein
MYKYVNDLILIKLWLSFVAVYKGLVETSFLSNITYCIPLLFNITWGFQDDHQEPIHETETN